MNQTIIDLYDRFTHGQISRRNFLDRLAVLAGGTAAATAMLPLLKNNYALAETVPEGDSRIKTETVTIAGINAYVAKPAQGTSGGGDKFPTVIVIHENRGLNPHIKDVTRRFATEGYLAVGVDMLTPLGGTHAAAGDRPAECRDQHHPRLTRRAGALRRAWRRTAGRHTDG